MSQDDTPVGLTSWVFFAAGAKPTSMRRALAVRLAEVEPVVIVGQPISLLRERRLPTLGERIMSLGGKHAWLYQPLHFPELVPLAGYLSRTLNRSSLKAELDQLLPRGVRRIVCYDSPTQHHLAGRLGEQLSIYLAVDDRTFTVRGQPIAGELAAEMRLLQKVDQVVCGESWTAPNGRSARR